MSGEAGLFRLPALDGADRLRRLVDREAQVLVVGARGAEAERLVGRLLGVAAGMADPPDGFVEILDREGQMDGSVLLPAEETDLLVRQSFDVTTGLHAFGNRVPAEDPGDPIP
ncbi:hypothetical protein [Actinomadura luteofluorescens]|uniref:hypothetical protein n=1 Tax=Actinomadura luteofluorescens TaxID=46163 RepID=UPI001FEB7AB9|nr:hypothetical protein [Actinomadura luteofluorescens]